MVERKATRIDLPVLIAILFEDELDFGVFSKQSSYSKFTNFDSKFLGQDPIPVWPTAEGKQRGVELKPLYHCVPASLLRYAVVKRGNAVWQCNFLKNGLKRLLLGIAMATGRAARLPNEPRFRGHHLGDGWSPEADRRGGSCGNRR